MGEERDAGRDRLRSRVATGLWLVCVGCALVLSLGALLVTLKVDQEVTVVASVLDVAGLLAGPLRRQDGVVSFSGPYATGQDVLVNWGLAAVLYLVVGAVLDRVVRPRPAPVQQVPENAHEEAGDL